jgi:uncharacterized coiled-coil protein SlyX
MTDYNLDKRMSTVEQRVDNHEIEIKILDKIARESQENMGVNRGMLQALHKRMDKADEARLTREDVRSAIEEQVPPMVKNAIEANVGKYATKIIMWVVGTTAFVVVTSILKDYMA